MDKVSVTKISKKVIGRVCSVDGCGRKHNCLGFCEAHYKKYKRCGDPLSGKMYAFRGDLTKWIHEHISYSGEGCLKWPYATDGHGYGQISYNGKRQKPHVVMCILKHGERPTPKHQAAHSCGQGHNGCIHPDHLRWATQSENQLDKALHGTDLRGEKHFNVKLTLKDVLEIRSTPESVNNCELGRMYNVNRTTIRDIRNGRSWAWLK